MNERILLISQGSQSIQLIRQFYAIGYKSESFFVLTIQETKNKCFLEFLNYYEIEFEITSSETFQEQLKNKLDSLKPTWIFSFSNPFIIKSEVLSYEGVFVNFHPGILPNYRGSLSTVHSLLNNEDYVGGSWHYIERKVDQGNILVKFEIPVHQVDTAFSLNHKIFAVGISNLDLVIDRIRNNFEGILQPAEGKFYKNKFPSIDHLEPKLKRRVTYFPPEFK